MSRLLMLGLDSFPPDLLDLWCSEGSLPNLRRLRDAGMSGIVTSEAKLFPAAVWPSFFTQSGVSEHGNFHIEQWDPERKMIRPPGDWCRVTPFWQTLATRGIPTVTIDVPFSDSGRAVPNAVEIIGWGMHEGMWQKSYPASLMREITSRHGAASQSREGPGERPDEEVVSELPGLVEDVRRRVAIIEDLAARFDWQLLLGVFTETHRAGHWFWSDRGTGIAHGGLKRVTMEFDRLLPRLEALLRPEDHLAIFSIHGMTETKDADRLGEAALLYLDPALNSSPARQLDPIHILRHRLPGGFVRYAARKMPQFLYNWAFFHLRNVGRDWQHLPYVVMPLDHLFYVAINPAAGGQESRQALEERLVAEIMGMTTLDGTQLVQELTRPKAMMPGTRRHLLPDLAVRSIHSEIGPVIRLADGSERPAPRHSNRDGEHSGNGFYIQTGPGISAGRNNSTVPGTKLAQLLCRPAGLDLS